MKRFSSNTIAMVSLLFIVLIIVGVVYIFSSGKDVLGVDKVDEEDEQPIVEKLKVVDVNSKSRPYAVMINNIGAARPYQSGLQDAYIVYEMVVEGGITRMLALFKDADTARIGSVRSARHYYLDYALENDAIYVHHGYSPQAQSDFSTLNVDRIEINTTTTGWRDKDLLNKGVSSEHTLFTSISALNKGLGNKRTETNKDLLLNYSASSVDYSDISNTKVAKNIEIAYANSNVMQYEYDEVNKVYKRSVNGKEHVDYVTKKQYTAKNIITYQVKNSTIVGGGKGRQELDNLGTGTGWLITEGKAIPIKWKKDSRSAQTVYTYENGKEIVVNDGNTFIQIQPIDQKLVIE